MGAGEDSSGVVALEAALAEKGIGAGKVMMTFGVTGAPKQCALAHEMAWNSALPLAA